MNNPTTLAALLSCALLGFGISFKKWWMILPGALGMVAVVAWIYSTGGNL